MMKPTELAKQVLGSAKRLPAPTGAVRPAWSFVSHVWKGICDVARQIWPLPIIMVLLFVSTKPFLSLFAAKAPVTPAPAPAADQVAGSIDENLLAAPRRINESIVTAREGLHDAIQTKLDPLGHSWMTGLLQHTGWRFVAIVVVGAGLLAAAAAARQSHRIGRPQASLFVARVACLLAVGFMLAAPLTLQKHVQVVKVTVVRQLQFGYEGLQARSTTTFINQPAAMAALGSEGVKAGGTEYVATILNGQPVTKVAGEQFQNYHAAPWEVASATMGAYAQATIDGLAQRFLATIAAVASAMLTLVANAFVAAVVLLMAVVGRGLAVVRRYVIVLAAGFGLLGLSTFLASVQAWFSLWLYNFLGPQFVWLEVLAVVVLTVVGMRLAVRFGPRLKAFIKRRRLQVQVKSGDRSRAKANARALTQVNQAVSDEETELVPIGGEAHEDAEG